MNTAVNDFDLESRLRNGLAGFADAAPTDIPDLSDRLARRLAGIRTRRRIGVSSLAVAVLAAGTGFLVFTHQARVGASAPQLSAARHQAPVGLAPDPLSCPPNLTDYRLNRSRSDEQASFLPGQPTTADICQYGLGVSSPSNAGAYLSGLSLQPLTNQLKALNNPSAETGCVVAATDAARPILMRFGYAHEPEVDVLITMDYQCTTVTNGALSRSVRYPLVIPFINDGGMSPQSGIPATTAPGRVLPRGTAPTRGKPSLPALQTGAPAPTTG